MKGGNRPLRMKVLFVSLEFVDPVFSGNGILSRSWVRTLSVHGGCDVLVLCAQPEKSNLGGSKFGEHVSVIAVKVPVWNKLDRSSSWKEYATGLLEHSEEINLFSPDIILGVDWTGSIAVNTLKQHVRALFHIPFIYLNFRVFSESTGITQEDKSFYIEKESDAISSSSQVIALSSHDGRILKNISITQKEIKILNPILRDDIRALARVSQMKITSTREAQSKYILAMDMKREQGQFNYKRCSSENHMIMPALQSRNEYSYMDRGRSTSLGSNSLAIPALGLSRTRSQIVLDKKLNAQRARYHKIRYGFGGAPTQRHRERDLEKWVLRPFNSQNSFQRKSNLDSRYLVTCCCRLCPEKNVGAFVEVAIRNSVFFKQHGIVPCLVGPKTDDHYASYIIDSLRAEYPEPGSLKIIPNFVSPSELGMLYSQTLINFHPAVYESFGMTIVEAASYGTPSLIDGSGMIGAADVLPGPKYSFMADMKKPRVVASVLRSILNPSRRFILHAVGSGAQRQALAWDEHEFAALAREHLDLALQNAFRANDITKYADKESVDSTISTNETSMLSFESFQSGGESDGDELWPWISILEWAANDATDGVVFSFDVHSLKTIVKEVTNTSVYDLASRLELALQEDESGVVQGKSKRTMQAILSEEQISWSFYFAKNAQDYQVVMATRYKLVPSRLSENAFWYGIFCLMRKCLWQTWAVKPEKSHLQTRIQMLERISQQYQNRGLSALFQTWNANSLLNAARDIQQSNSVLMLTGFPCCINNQKTPQETDGPIGTGHLARAIHALGLPMTIIIETTNAGPLEACISSLLQRTEAKDDDLSRSYFGKEGQVCLETFPCEWTQAHSNRLEELLFEFKDGHLISLERAGPAKDGVCYTMNGRAMTQDVLAPLHEIFDPNRLSKTFPGIRTTAIGDGGNEVGMGQVDITDHVENGEQIACILPCDNLILCTVSNWGGYSLAAAIAMIAVADGKYVPSKATLDLFMGTDEDARQVLEACALAGAWDGCTGAPGRSVDSFSFEENLKIFNQLKSSVLEYWSDL